MAILGKPNLSEGAILALAPAAGYGFAMAFEAGYLSHFRIPLEFVSISIGQVLFAVAVVASVLFTFLGMANLLFPLSESKRIPAPIRKRLGEINYVLLAASFFFFWAEAKSLAIISAAMGVLFALIMFVFPLFSQRDVRGYVAKLEAQDSCVDEKKSSAADESETLHQKIWIRYPLVGFLMWAAYMTFLVGLGIFFIGNGRATKTRTFYVSEDTPGYCAIRLYEDRAILVDFDESTRTFGDHVIVLNLERTERVKFQHRELGKLRYRYPTKLSEHQ